MLTNLLAALHLDQPDSLKRALAALFGGIATVALPALNPVLAAHGLPSIPAESIPGAMAALAGLTATFLLQSGANAAVAKLADAKAAGATAAAAVTTVDQANAVLKAAADVEAPK